MGLASNKVQWFLWSLKHLFSLHHWFAVGASPGSASPWRIDPEHTQSQLFQHARHQTIVFFCAEVFKRRLCARRLMDFAKVRFGCLCWHTSCLWITIRLEEALTILQMKSFYFYKYWRISHSTMILFNNSYSIFNTLHWLRLYPSSVENTDKPYFTLFSNTAHHGHHKVLEMQQLLRWKHFQHWESLPELPMYFLLRPIMFDVCCLRQMISVAVKDNANQDTWKREYSLRESNSKGDISSPSKWWLDHSTSQLWYHPSPHGPLLRWQKQREGPTQQLFFLNQGGFDVFWSTAYNKRHWLW